MGSMRYTKCEVRGKRGFSLIEILIAVSIIIVLASIVIGVATHFDNKSKEKAVESTIAILEGALQEYYDYTGDFPVLTSVDANENSERLYEALSLVPGARKTLEQVAQELIQNKPRDANDVFLEIYDIWGTVLDYRYDPNIYSYPVIISAGPDREFGSSDDISNRD